VVVSRRTNEAHVVAKSPRRNELSRRDEVVGVVLPRLRRLRELGCRTSVDAPVIAPRFERVEIA
jgi:hypothetical protein